MEKLNDLIERNNSIISTYEEKKEMLENDLLQVEVVLSPECCQEAVECDTSSRT